MPAELIAHGIANSSEAFRAFERGATLAEINVSLGFLTRLVIQHQGILGALGIGQSLESFLAQNKDRLLIDIKHPRFSLNFAQKLSAMLSRLGIEEANVCGRNWSTVSQVCEANNLPAYYTLESQHSIDEFRAASQKLRPAEGVSVEHSLIDSDFMGEFQQNRGLRILAWKVESQDVAKRLEDLKVDAMIASSPFILMKGL